MTFPLPCAQMGCYATGVISADAILTTLKDRGVTNAAIAKVLGVATTNATMLFNPAKKTGKPRRLTYDEGIKLIEAFNLAPEAGSPPEPISLPVSRLAVRYVGTRLGVDVDRDPALFEELAQDIQAFSAFSSQPHMRDSVGHTEGFFAGLETAKRA